MVEVPLGRATEWPVTAAHSFCFLAIFYTAAILGPAAGYLVGGAMLNIYTEVGQR